MHGDLVTIHNVRNCDYRAEFDYTCRWETRTYDLSQLRGVDTYIVYWGSPWIAHTMLSFEFGKDEHIVFSIETRKEIGQFYSACLRHRQSAESVGVTRNYVSQSGARS